MAGGRSALAGFVLKARGWPIFPIPPRTRYVPLAEGIIYVGGNPDCPFDPARPSNQSRHLTSAISDHFAEALNDRAARIAAGRQTHKIISTNLARSGGQAGWPR